MFVTCLAMQYLVSFLVLQSFVGEERASCFTLIVLLMSRDCYCPVTLPHSAVGWSAVCDYDIS